MASCEASGDPRIDPAPTSVGFPATPRTAGCGSEQVGFRFALADEARLVLQKPAFAMEPAAIAGEALVRADDTVARHDDGDRILVVRKAHRASGARLADGL